MNRNDAIITIAKNSGWNKVELIEINYFIPRKKIVGIAPDGKEKYVPNYFNDLNAIHEVELTLSDKSPGKDKDGNALSSERALYRVNLCLICMNNGGPISATATQRAEAFLKTIGKWID